MNSSSEKSYSQLKLRRTLVLAGIVFAVLAAFAAGGYHLFTGWRARDLAAKAKENFDRGNYRLAWLQVNSAKDLRGEEPDVLRALGLIEAAMGRATALGHYEALSRQTSLSPEDLKTRAEIAMRFGDDGQFAQAVDGLEKAGLAKEAGQIRTARKLRKGDMDSAIAEARAAAAASDDAALKLSLARVLVQRYRPEMQPGLEPSAKALAGSDEAIDIVDSLIGTPLRNEALAFALNEIKTTPENRVRWANAAMEKIEADNPALLPAAAVLVRGGQKTPRQIHEQFRPVFDAAPLERRASYALWLTGAGMPQEALTLITAREAGESTAAFGARTEAFFAMNNTDAVMSAVEEGGNVETDIKLAVKARAEYARDHDAKGAKALGEAMDAAAKGGRLELIIPTGDSLGATAVVDEKLAELCNDPSLSDYVFRVARERFSRSGNMSALTAAFARAQSASPQSASVQDHARYRKLLEGRPVDLAETSAACAAERPNVIFRITHALNLLNHGKPADALRSFDDITVFADRLPAGQLAVLAAVLAANGDKERASAAALAIDPDRLLPGEYALIAPLRAPSAVR